MCNMTKCSGGGCKSSSKIDIMSPFNTLVYRTLVSGKVKGDRTGTGTKSVFGEHLRFDVSEFAPFYTQRKLPLKSTIGELLWFIEGSTDVNVLRGDYKCTFWDEWANDKTGTIGPMYGEQWRNADGVDQLKETIDILVKDPESRRMVVNSWLAKYLPDINISPKDNPLNGKMALAPCHSMFQLNGTIRRCQDNYVDVDLQFYQRSADAILGAPINIASYYILLCIICKIATKQSDKYIFKPRQLSVSYGDFHVYNNHIDEATSTIGLESYSPARMVLPDEVGNLLDTPWDSEKRKYYRELIFNSIKRYEAHPNVKLDRNV